MDFEKRIDSLNSSIKSNFDDVAMDIASIIKYLKGQGYKHNREQFSYPSEKEDSSLLSNHIHHWYDDAKKPEKQRCSVLNCFKVRFKPKEPRNSDSFSSVVKKLTRRVSEVNKLKQDYASLKKNYDLCKNEWKKENAELVSELTKFKELHKTEYDFRGVMQTERDGWKDKYDHLKHIEEKKEQRISEALEWVRQDNWAKTIKVMFLPLIKILDGTFSKKVPEGE